MRHCSTLSSKPAVGGLLLLLVVYSSGCHSTTPGNTLFSRSNSLPPAKALRRAVRTAPAPAELGCGDPSRHGTGLGNPELLKEEPGLVRAGRGVIGPDGTLILGPLRNVPPPWEGSRFRRPARAWRNTSTPWVKGPTVRLSTVLPEAATREIAWRAAPTGAPAGVSVAGLSQPSSPIRPTAYQSGKENGPLLPPREDAGQTLPMPQTMPGAPPVTYGPTMGMGAPMVGPPLPHGPLKAPSELNRVVLPPYVIGVSDVLMINALGRQS